jgi:1,3-beta-glucanosyltransferase GAS5
MTDGAGDGPGLDGPGSQEAGDGVHTTAGANAGSPTATAASSDSGSAGARPMPPFDTAILGVAGVVTLFTAVGTLLL